MTTEDEAYTTTIDGWVVRIQPPKDRSAQRSLLLLHGWTGDETVMWIFAHNLPHDAWIFAPRAPLTLDGMSGYAWLRHGESLPTLNDYAQPAADLAEAYRRWTEETGAPETAPDVMGFSQGAGMAFALAALHPRQVERVIALAGFLPEESPLPGRYQALFGRHVYIAHGARDEIIPVERAQQAVQALQDAGAQVTYCESDVGHKLSADCLRGLNHFLST